ncbi:hypothetical protein BJ165DRAFT_1404263 [Panaeolus papilionaceus]|nr:hypothetical protein BJ165DRAFT_1404263 [Panaeolus papilionaceus]
MSSHLHYSQHQHQHHTNSYHPHAPSHLSRSHSLPLSNGSGSGSSAPESIAHSTSHNPLLTTSSLSHIANPLSNPHSSQMHAFPDTAIPPTPAPERASEASSAWQTSLQMRVMQQLDQQLQEAHANYQKQLAGFHQAQQAQLAGLQGLVAQQQAQAQQGQQQEGQGQQQKAVGSPLLRTQSPPSSFAPFHVPVTPMPGAGVPNTPLPSLLPLMSPNLSSLPLASSTPANALSGMDLLRLQSPAALLYQLELQYNATIQQLQMHAASTLQAELEREAVARSQLGGGFNGEGVRATLKGAGVVDDNDDDEDESESGEEGSDGDSEDNEESDDEESVTSKMGGMRLSGAQKGKGRAVEGDHAQGEGQRGGVDDQLDMLNEIYRRNQARLAHVAASTPSPAPYQHSPSHSPPLDGEQEEVGGESGYESSGVMSEGGEGGFDTDREDTSRAVRRARAPSIDLKDVDPDEADIRTALRLRTSYLNLPLVPLSSNPNGGFSEDSFERLQAQLRAENQKRIQDEFRRRAEGIRERKKKDKEDGVLSDTSVSEAVSEGAVVKKDAGKDKGKEYPLSDSDVRQTRALVRSSSPAYTSRSPSISTSTSHSSRAASPAPFAYPTTKTPYAPSYASHHSYAGYGGYTSSYGGYGTYGSPSPYGGYAGGGSAPGYASASSASSASGVSTPSTSVYGGSAHSSPAKPQFKTFSALGTSSSSASSTNTSSGTTSTASTTTTSTGATSSPFYTLHPKNQHSLHIHSQSASASTTSSNASSAATSPVGTTFKGLPFGGGGMLLSSGNASGGGTQVMGTPKKSGQERWLPPGVRR